MNEGERLHGTENTPFETTSLLLGSEAGLAWFVRGLGGDVGRAKSAKELELVFGDVLQLGMPHLSRKDSMGFLWRGGVEDEVVEVVPELPMEDGRAISCDDAAPPAEDHIVASLVQLRDREEELAQARHMQAVFEDKRGPPCGAWQSEGTGPNSQALGLGESTQKRLRLGERLVVSEQGDVVAHGSRAP